MQCTLRYQSTKKYFCTPSVREKNLPKKPGLLQRQSPGFSALWDNSTVHQVEYSSAVRIESISISIQPCQKFKEKTLNFKRISSINLNKDTVQFLDNSTFAVGYFGVQQLFPAPKFGRAPQTTKFSQHGGRPASIACRSLPSKMTDLLCKMKAVAGWAPAPWAGDFLPLVVFPLARHDAAREKTLRYIRVVLF